MEVRFDVSCKSSNTESILRAFFAGRCNIVLLRWCLLLLLLSLAKLLHVLKFQLCCFISFLQYIRSNFLHVFDATQLCRKLSNARESFFDVA